LFFNELRRKIFFKIGDFFILRILFKSLYINELDGKIALFFGKNEKFSLSDMKTGFTLFIEFSVLLIRVCILKIQ